MIGKRGYALALFTLIFLLSYMHFAYAASQFARPDQTLNNAGSYVASSGSVLYTMLDEVSFDDNDYINSSQTATHNAVNISLSSIISPSNKTVQLNLRARKSITGVQNTRIRAKIFDGSVEIDDFISANLPTSYTNVTRFFNGSSITNWNNLTVEIGKDADAGLPRSKLQVSWAEMKVQDPNPKFYFNLTNTTSQFINQKIKFNINWTDTIGLSLNFFETNITGVIKNFTTQLSGKTRNVNITNLSSGLTGRFYWKSYTNDSAGSWNYTSQMFFNVSSSTTTSTTTSTTVLPTSTGGGGGGSKSVFDFSIYPDAFKVLLKPGQTLYRDLIIKNTGNRLLTDIGILPDMQDFIGLSDNKFSLKPGEEKVVTVSFSSSTDKQPGIYNGVISVETSRIIKKILSIIEVIELKPLFDIKVELAQVYQSITPGQIVDANIILYNFGDLKPVDVQLYYSLKDIEGNDIASKEEAIAVTEQKQITRSLSIPLDAKPGNYLFYSKIIYGENAQASGSSLFKISAVQLQPSSSNYTTIIILGIASLLLILAIIELIRMIVRYRKSSNYKSYYPMLRSEILSRLQQGYNKEQIIESAKQAGWPESIVKSALLGI